MPRKKREQPSAVLPYVEVEGVRVPTFIYGTAWKEDETERLVGLALAAGFRGVDTANQRKHYHEAGVGEAVRRALEAGVVRRDELFLQTKYTYLQGQDHRLPYDPAAPVGEQVRQSCASSLEHLHVDHLDAYVLHGPSTGEGLAPADFEAWAAMERLHADGAARLLGVSNVTREQLETLWGRATIRPALVQNRCYARLGWDRDVRAFCREHGMLYEGFSLLTANRKELAHPEFLALVARLGATPAQVVFRFALAVGMVPLTGTTDPEHMRLDLASGAVALGPEDVRLIERVADLG